MRLHKQKLFQLWFLKNFEKCFKMYLPHNLQQIQKFWLILLQITPICYNYNFFSTKGHFKYRNASVWHFRRSCVEKWICWSGNFAQLREEVARSPKNLSVFQNKFFLLFTLANFVQIILNFGYFDINLTISDKVFEFPT